MTKGKYYPDGSSKEYEAQLDIQADMLYLYIDENIHVSDLRKNVHVSDRLANTKRKITFSDGSTFFTSENSVIDMYFKKTSKINHFIYSLESKIPYVVSFLVLIVLTTGVFFKYGLPALSESLAFMLPQKTNDLIAYNTMNVLDEYIFEPSTLSIKEKTKIRKHFNEILAPLTSKDDGNFTLHFRLFEDGNKSIANAMALPSGDIILTDAFIHFCATQDEMDSVLLHEMGHVLHRHTLQRLIEASFISVVTMMVVGDTNAMGDMGVGLGALLLSSQYSQNHETQADTYAFKSMLALSIDPHSFATIMSKIDSTYLTKKDEKILPYISSHPSTIERIEHANKYSEIYKKSIKQ